MAAAFPSYPVTGIKVSDGLHLKSFITMAGPDLISVGMSVIAREVRKAIEDKGRFKYRYFEVPDNTGANCLYLNNTLIHVAKDTFPESCARFEQLDTPARKIPLLSSELNKADGCFTCTSVLIK
jgi:dimethylargininase